MPLVFDDIARDLAGPHQAGEPQFAYLNRSSRVEAERVRERIEAWVAAYPAGDRKGLVSRLRSQTDEEHYSAVFELVLHALLLRTGHTILAIEPALDHSPNRPDFLVEAPDGVRFYLEAVTVTGKSKAEVGRERLLSSARKVIETAKAPNHFLDLHTEGMPEQPISLKTLRKRLAAWIAALPGGEAAKDVARFVYEEHGVTFTVGAFPRLHAADDDDLAIGISWGEPVWIVPGRDEKQSLDHRASRYGDLGLPFVVAVNQLGEYNNEAHIRDALFGSPCAIGKEKADGTIEWVAGRKRDGVWVGKTGPRKQGLSAVLAFGRIDAWGFGQRRCRLWRNPWPTHVLPEIPLRVPEANPEGDDIVLKTGESLAEIFGLPASWPEDAPA